MKLNSGHYGFWEENLRQLFLSCDPGFPQNQLDNINGIHTCSMFRSGDLFDCGGSKAWAGCPRSLSREHELKNIKKNTPRGETEEYLLLKCKSGLDKVDIM